MRAAAHAPFLNVHQHVHKSWTQNRPNVVHGSVAPLAVAGGRGRSCHVSLFCSKITWFFSITKKQGTVWPLLIRLRVDSNDIWLNYLFHTYALLYRDILGYRYFTRVLSCHAFRNLRYFIQPIATDYAILWPLPVLRFTSQVRARHTAHYNTCMYKWYL